MASINKNSSLSYTGRDQADIRRELVSLVPGLTEKWRDFSPSDLGMIVLEIIAGSQDMQNFYLDNQAFETFLDMAEQDKNIRSHLRAMNYRIPFTGSAKGEVYLYFKEYPKNITIPKYTQLICKDNDITYSTIDSTTISSANEVTDEDNKFYGLYKADTSLKVMEGVVRSFTVDKDTLLSRTTIDGSVSRRIYLEGGDSKGYSDKSVWIRHSRNSEPFNIYWTEVDDAILEYNGGTVYSVHQDSYGEVYILMSVNFIDYINEADEITIYWVQTLGADGIATPGTDTEIDRFISFTDGDNTITVYQEEATTGAYSIPNLSELKPLARRQAQNLDRYITIDDFKNGTATEPYIFRYVVKDWKSPTYVNLPYQVKIWAVNFDGGNLGNQDIQTLKNKFYSKGVTDIEIVYVLTNFVKIRIDVVLLLKVSTEANQESLRNSVKTYLEELLEYSTLNYGQKISLMMLDSQIRSVSSYIKSPNVSLFTGETKNITEYSGYASSGVSSIEIRHNMTNSEKLQKIESAKKLINTDLVEISEEYNINTLSSVTELEVIEWKEVGDVVLDEIEFPKIYEINVTSTQEDSGVEI